ncbi:MAG TPA: hypothetical protein DD729_09595 [Rhodobacteraceae bacterium]|jgi:uncharacterized protein YjiS (DUF1127 family)|nr:hypothetical protein [Paracoccaceae bacterium]
MTCTTTTPKASLQSFIPQSPLALVVVTLATTVLTWDLRRRTRRTLKTLTDAQLDDIGLSRVEAYTEARRLFWQG